MDNRSFTNRIIILDTETTGLNPQEGHRVIEIGCVEMIKRRITGRHFHVYINPDRLIDEGAIAVHGISNEFLEDKPRFEQILEDFLDFIKDAELVIHNAPFDVGFINNELALINSTLGKVEDYSKVFDSLIYARKKHPGQRNSLDALCKRYGVDNSQRDLHGALLDAEILAEVFLLMTGGQSSLLDQINLEEKQIYNDTAKYTLNNRPALKIITSNEIERLAHQQTLLNIQKSGVQCLWPNAKSTAQ